MDNELIKAIQSYDKETGVSARKSLETHPMNKEAIEAEYSRLTLKEVQDGLLDYLKKKGNIDNYNKYVILLAGNKKLVTMNEDQQELVDDIRIEFDIPDFSGIDSEAKRKYFNALVDEKLDDIQLHIDMYDDTGELNLGELMMSYFIYDFIFMDNLSNEYERKEAIRKAREDLFNGNLSNIVIK